MKRIFFLLLIGLLIVVLFIKKKEGQEGYTNTTMQYSHTVNLPINTSVSCDNKCGPPNRCSITGEQCSTDVDCYGCQVMDKTTSSFSSVEVPGYYDAGNRKNPYSVLTIDATNNVGKLKTSEAPPVYFQGVNTWRQAFDTGNALYNQKYNPSLAFQPFLPRYAPRPTLSGEFVDDGPPAANS